MNDEKRLSDGRVFTCSATSKAIDVSLGQSLIHLPGWRGGIGGLELVLSADERFAVVFLYSGQSSQGFEVFELEPTLRHVGTAPERRGHGSAPQFCGSFVVSFLDTDPKLRDTGEYFEEVQDAADDRRCVVDWAALQIFSLSDATLVTVPVGVELARSTDLDLVQSWEPFDVLRVSGPNEVTLALPWGDSMRVALPSSGPLISTENL